MDKYCKRCGAGMMKPKPHARVFLRSLFRVGFCSEECKELGARQRLFAPKTVKKKFYQPSSGNVAEEMAFRSIEIERAEAEGGAILSFVRRAQSFRFLSEKLSYLEKMTGQRWYPSRYYIWKNKL